MAGLSRRVRHLEGLFAVTMLEMAEAQAHIADHLDGRGKELLTDSENAADRRFFLRELVREFGKRGDDVSLAEVRAELGPDSDELVAADEALLEAWATL